jgi:hypothetical protein
MIDPQIVTASQGIGHEADDATNGWHGQGGALRKGFRQGLTWHVLQGQVRPSVTAEEPFFPVTHDRRPAVVLVQILENLRFLKKLIDGFLTIAPSPREPPLGPEDLQHHRFPRFVIPGYIEFGARAWM